MYNSKKYITNKSIALMLCVFAILNIFSGCTFSDRMCADVGFVCNRDTNYSYIPYSETSFYYENNETGESKEYTWGYFDFSPDGVDLNQIGSYVACLNSNFAIVTYKDDSWQGIHSNKLHKHVADELVYLNPKSKNAELLFRSNACEIIIYGTFEYVIIYNAEYNVYRYVSLANDSIIYEEESHIDPFVGDYGFDIYEKECIFKVYKYNTISGTATLVDSVCLDPYEYLK